MVKKRRKKGITTKLGEKLDIIWAVLTKVRAGHKCEKCGSSESLNSHHIFGRVCKSVRWNLSNACVLCSSCHFFSSDFSAHQTPLEFTAWIIANRGDEWYEDLVQLKNTIKKWTIKEKKELLEEYTEMLNNG